jgi:protein-S-isoprenylcysteine O-methyltransferase Ste14
VNAVIYVLIGLWAAGELASQLSHRGGTHVGQDPTEVVMAVGLIAAFVGVSLELGRDDPQWGTRVRIVGIAVLVAGIALRAWSIRTLGRFFTYAVTVQEDQHVVDEGPYRVLRHPSYTGLLVALAGLGVAAGAWTALALAVLPPLLAVVVRIRHEEGALERELGDAYRAYEQRTRRLVPGLW